MRAFKNAVKQTPGLSNDILQWMHAEAERKLSDRCGGILLDEMSVQEDLTLDKRKGSIKLTGLVNVGQEAKCMKEMNSGSTEARLATHILQLVFLGYDGFRFPFAHYPCEQVNAPELFFIFWQAVVKLHLYSFQVDFVCMDGASANRTFLKMHFPSDQSHTTFSATNLHHPSKQIVFLMDYSHVLKRIRNSVYSSGEKKHHCRKLQLNGTSILWDHWIEVAIEALP